MNIILTAKDYQARFKAGLILCGFGEYGPQWLGTDKEFEKAKELLNQYYA
jgi:hypothetical protein